MLTDITSIDAGPVAKFPPTPEQKAIIEAFKTGEDVVVDALAGTGKTTTLKMLAGAQPNRRGLYLCYNKAAADDAKADFPSSVKCMTIHSLAYRSVGHKYRSRMNAKRIPPWDLADWLGVYGDFKINDDVSLTPMVVASRVMDTVRRFCYSDDDQIHARHVPLVRGAEDYMPKVQKYLLPMARKAWDDLKNPAGTNTTFFHDVYAKLFALSSPVLDFDYITVDESQDSNPLMAQIVKNQSCQKVWVGDENQCLYAWRSAMNVMKHLTVPHRLSLTKSFRFGEVVAKEGQKWLTLLESPLELKGYEKINSQLATLSDPDATLCRTNAQVISETIEAQSAGKKVHMVGGSGEIEKFVKAAEDLQKGKRTMHPDLAAFENWGQVEHYSLTDEGSDLRVFVKLIEQHGCAALRAISEKTVEEIDADIVISTAHRAKGREWDKVKIASDFESILGEDGEISQPMMMLSYVAVTRAKKFLDRGGLSFIDRLVGEDND